MISVFKKTIGAGACRVTGSVSLPHAVRYNTQKVVVSFFHMADKCAKCGRDAKGYKCDSCGAERKNHDSNHACGGNHCMPKCSGCNEAHSKCACG